MENVWAGFAIGVAASAFAVAVVTFARAGGAANAYRGLTLAGRAHADPAYAQKVRELLAVPFEIDARATTPAPRLNTSTPPAPTTKPAAPPGDPLQLLGLLQTEARLIDFLMEDLSGASAAQVGQAALDIHRKARQVLKDHVTLTEILAGGDGDSVTVPAGFDPGAIRLVGNVTGTPPFTGTLQHPGWKATAVSLPTRPAGQDPAVLQPAEVALG